MLGVFVNMGTVILGGLVGLLLKKGLPEKITSAVMTAVGLCTVYIGIDGALKGENTIVLILSMAIGAAAGTAVDIDEKITRLAGFAEKKLTKGKKGGSSFAQGFVSGSLLFCVGAMSLVGSLNSGLYGDNTLIYTKACLDLISSCILASTLGCGVIFASLFILVYQGGLVLLSQWLGVLLTDEAMLNEIVSAGSVTVIGLGLNLVGLKHIKAANLLPGLILCPLFYYLYSLLPI